MTDTVIKTISVRVRDKHRALLSRMAFDVNQVWNEANEVSDMCSWVPLSEVGFMNMNTSAFDLIKELKGIRQERGMIISATTCQQVILKHGQARKQFKKNKLGWRTSGGPRRNLGWVPFRGRDVKWINGQIRFYGHYFKVWDSYGLSNFKFKAGSFNQDSRGRWYFNAAVEVKREVTQATGQVGVDFGLKTTATCSDGTTLERAEFYRKSEKKLATLQRANKKYQVRNLHAKIKNQRKDLNHKFSTKLVKENCLIVVGDVSSAKLAKTKMGKSVLDAGWHQLKTQIDYKSKAMRSVYIEVNESYTTQSCSCCGEITCNSPKGRVGLGIREWTCAKCGALHDRDINAAKNILALGCQSLAVGISTL